MSATALYYPHTTLRSEGLMRASLLLWDHVDCIVPHAQHPIATDLDGDMRAAAELLLRPRVPTDAHQMAVDGKLSALLEDGVPSWLLRDIVATDDPRHGHSAGPPGFGFLIYPEKFLSDTWRRLEQHGIARFFDRFNDYAVPPALGLSMMAALAEAMAFKSQHQITDRADAYRHVVGIGSTALGGDLLPGTAAAVSDSIDRLLTLPIPTVNLNRVPLRRVLELRQKEARESSGDLRQMRRAYLNAVKEYVSSATAPGLDADEVHELTTEFQDSIERDLKELRRELRIARNDVFLSREAGVLVLAAAGVAASGPGAIPALVTALKTVGVGALIGTGAKYVRARRKALQGHRSAWLFATRPRLPDFVTTQ